MIRVPALLVIAVALAVTAIEWCVGMSLCDGNFVYPLDDTYIHFALAKQLATDGTWGFESGRYAFASSSPLWTVLLALTFRLIGCHEWIPLVYSNLCAALSIWIVVGAWRKLGMPAAAQVAFGFLLVFVVPFVTLANLGMEHALHTACVAWMVSSLVAFVEKREFRKIVALCISTILATATRYETLFLVAPMTVLLFADRQWRQAVPVMLSAAFPMVLYGVFSYAHGGGFLPMSMSLKTGPADTALIRGITGLLSNISADNIHGYLMLVLMLVCAARTTVERSIRQVAMIVAIAIGGHMVLAMLGWLYRYECYLVLTVFMLLPIVRDNSGIVRTTHEHGFLRLAPICLVVLFLVPFLWRGFTANIDTVLAQREIYGQHVQLGRIFAALPADQRGPVAVNDLGYVVSHAGVHVLDIWGLGSDDVAKIKIAQQMTPERSAELFQEHEIRYAAFYPNWYSIAQLSPRLIPVASLETDASIICGGKEVLLCVARPEDVEPFRKHLTSIASSFPAGTKLRCSAQ